MSTKYVFAWVPLFTAACMACAQGERRLSVDDYRDRMKGGWIGQIIGVVWGAPTEFKFNDVIVPEDKVPVWVPEMINNAFGQDDLYVEMTFLRSLEQYGLDVPIRQAGIDFANSEYALWCANNAGRTNLRKGIAPQPELALFGTHRLVTSGVYAWVRHPMLSGGLLFLITSGPSLNNLVYTGMYAAYMAIGGYFEERRLLRVFGDDYARYRMRVGAFFPRLWPGAAG